MEGNIKFLTDKKANKTLTKTTVKVKPISIKFQRKLNRSRDPMEETRNLNHRYLYSI